MNEIARDINNAARLINLFYLDCFKIK